MDFLSHVIFLKTLQAYLPAFFLVDLVDLAAAFVASAFPLVVLAALCAAFGSSTFVLARGLLCFGLRLGCLRRLGCLACLLRSRWLFHLGHHAMGRLALGHCQNDVRPPALIAEGAAHRRRADALQARPVVGQGRLDVEIVHVQIDALLAGHVLCVVHRRGQQLMNHRGNALLGEGHCCRALLQPPGPGLRPAIAAGDGPATAARPR